MVDGRKIPWWIKKGSPNPMEDSDSIEKMKKSLKRTLDNMEIHPNKNRKRPDMIGKNLLSGEQLKRCSERMKENNPMKNLQVVEKQRTTFKMVMSQEGYVHPNVGKSRPDAQKRLLDPKKNPMKDPKKARRVWKKAKETLRKKGGISEGEALVGSILSALHYSFEREKYFKLNREEEIRGCFVDFYLSKLNLVIEYDGFQGHYSKEGKLKDDLRDHLLVELFGVKILRLERSEVFRETFPEELKRKINEMV